MLKRLGVCVSIILLAVLVLLPVVPRTANASIPAGTSISSDAGSLEAMLRSYKDSDPTVLTTAEVRKIQQILEGLGYSCGGADGILGPKTANAIQAFRNDRQQGLAPVADKKLSYSEIRINIPEFALALMEGTKVIRTFDIAVGTPYEQTPIGRFTIFSKIEDPTWYPGANFTDRTPVPPGPDNPLGTRWMEFFDNYGIHGTNKDWDILYPVSGGCVRMHDKEARQLFDIVHIGTPVTIVYETMKAIEKEDGLYLKIFPDIYRKNTTNPEKFNQLSEPYAAAGYKIITPFSSLPKSVDDVYETKIGIKAPPAAPEPLPRSVLEFTPKKQLTIQKKK